MSKQLIMITAPFNCGFCKTAQKELPEVCKKNGFELIEIANESKPDEDLPVDTYPTFMVRVNENITNTIKGYEKENIIKEMKKH